MRAEPLAKPPAPDPIEQRYRDDVAAAFGRLTLHGLPETRHDVTSLPLEDAFVRLNLRLRGDGGADLLDRLELRAGEDWRQAREATLERAQARFAGGDGAANIPPVNLAEALSRAPHLAVVGPPGSGKTMLTRWLAVGFARSVQGEPDRLGPAFRHPRLPVVIELRRLVRWIKEPECFPGPDGLAPRLADFIADDARFHGGVRDRLRAAVERGGCLLLFDGLDEVADDGLRGRIVEAIAALARSAGAGGNLILVTGRPAGFRGVDLGPGFRIAGVQPFAPEDVRRFLDHWYRTAYGPAHEGEAAELARQIEARERIRELATNPLLCTVIAVVYRRRRVLPHRRVDLYEECCRVLLDTWERTKEGGEELGLIGMLETSTQLVLLGEVAFDLHGRGEGGAPGREEVIELLWPSLARLRNLAEADARREATTFVGAVEHRAGLLQGRGDGALEFPRRTFQEYLAARHIAEQPGDAPLDLVMPHLHEAWWREVHLLTLGALGTDTRDAPRAARLIATILDHNPKPWPPLRSRRLPWRIVGWLLPGWQLDRRIGWLLGRDLELATRGFADAKPEGRDAATGDRLQRQLAEFVERCLHDEAARPRLAILGEDIREVVDARIIDALLRALADEDASVRRAAAYGLGRAGAADARAVDRLLALTQYWHSNQMRAVALEGLAGCKPDEVRLRRVLRSIGRSLCSYDASLRTQALQTAARLLDGRPFPGYRWVPLAERARRTRVRLWWAAGIFGVLALAMVAVMLVLMQQWLGADSLAATAATLFGTLLATIATAVSILKAIGAGKTS